MSCNISKFDFCMLQQETFTSPTFEFENTDVSNDTFVYTVFKSFGSAKKEFPVNFIDDNTVYIEEIKMLLGDYQHELLWIRNGIKEVVFQGSLKVTDKGSNCGCTSNKNIIKIVNEDVVVKVNYSERVIERITDKGPKGDSAYQVAVENGFVGTEAEWLESLKLHYSDLTEAEILELQQPAIEAAQTANQSADNANTATQNAITATNEANAATDNANQSAQTANASATNADNSAGLATTAAQSANDAATAANTAASFANSQRGWTPIHVFESDGAQRQVKKLTDYIGGTGDKPTQNIGQYVLDGGYTTDKSLATNFKGAQSDNLIVEYTHMGNKEIYFSNIDWATGIATTTQPHGVVANINAPMLTMNGIPEFYKMELNGLDFQANYMSIPVEYQVLGLRVEVIDANTLKLTNNDANIVVNPTSVPNNGNIDFSKFHLEIPQPFIISNLPQGIKSLKIVCDGVIRYSGSKYIAFGGYTENGLIVNNAYYPITGLNSLFPGFIFQQTFGGVQNNNTQNIMHNFTIEAGIGVKGIGFSSRYVRQMTRNITLGTFAAAWGVESQAQLGLSFLPTIKSMASVSFADYIPANGSTIQIYKL